MADQVYEHLGLKGWPFNIVPSEETAAVWVGRPELKRKLKLLLRTASRVPASQLIFLWASFGQGKTHALRHLEGLAHEAPDMIPIYVVTPKGIRSFVDIYRAIADAAIKSGLLVPAGRDLFDRTGGHVASDVERAIVRMAMYTEEESRTAASWLRAERVPVKDLKDIGISQRIETSADAVEALNQLILVLQREGREKVLFLMDEVQELAELGKRLSECVGGLHKVFDRNTQGLTMVLTFTTATQVALKGIIGETLFDRGSDTLTLPALRQPEAMELVEGLMGEWSVDPTKAPRPFTKPAVAAVVKALAASFEQLTPRTVIKHFGKLLREADIDIDEGAISEIDDVYAMEHLALEAEEE